MFLKDNAALFVQQSIPVHHRVSPILTDKVGNHQLAKLVFVTMEQSAARRSRVFQRNVTMRMFLKDSVVLSVLQWL